MEPPQAELSQQFLERVLHKKWKLAETMEPGDNDGTILTRRLWVWEQNQVIRQVACGAVHVVALSEDGLLQAWGYNEFGQLGRGVTCEGL
ncbi:hypothetical protein ACET3Z_002396 [Daucus carota]